MNAIISNGNYTARVQLPVERRQLYSCICLLKDIGGKSPIPKGISGFLWFFINIW